MLRVTFSQKLLVAQIAQECARRRLVILHLNHQWTTRAQLRQGPFDHAGKLSIGEQHLGLAMLQHEGNGLDVQARVERVEHRSGHRHTKVGLKHRGHIGQHHRHRVTFANPPTLQGRGQAATALIGLRPGLAFCAVHDGVAVRVDLRSTLQKTER